MNNKNTVNKIWLSTDAPDVLNTLTDIPLDVMFATVQKYALLVPQLAKTIKVLLGWVEPNVILSIPVPPFAAVKEAPSDDNIVADGPDNWPAQKNMWEQKFEPLTAPFKIKSPEIVALLPTVRLFEIVALFETVILVALKAVFKPIWTWPFKGSFTLFIFKNDFTNSELEVVNICDTYALLPTQLNTGTHAAVPDNVVIVFLKYTRYSSFCIIIT